MLKVEDGGEGKANIKALRETGKKTLEVLQLFDENSITWETFLKASHKMVRTKPLNTP